MTHIFDTSRQSGGLAQTLVGMAISPDLKPTDHRSPYRRVAINDPVKPTPAPQLEYWEADLERVAERARLERGERIWRCVVSTAEASNVAGGLPPLPTAGELPTPEEPTMLAGDGWEYDPMTDCWRKHWSWRGRENDPAPAFRPGKVAGDAEAWPVRAHSLAGRLRLRGQ